ncbi:uncharacterized protein RJT21DRAFT_124472 [Scheffersomyces amazonensis]|uniref:uncharacterized protein n=1 Tax=Scheffersomyces amazonensis TaxID=1078765 RepID=UPI00315CC913
MLNLSNPATIETYSCNFHTDNTPNSKYPVLVYRNVLNKEFLNAATTEEDKVIQLNESLLPNGWSAEQTWGTSLNTHYHYNVHEAYFVIQGSSTLILGLDVTIIPSNNEDNFQNLSNKSYLEITLNTGDLIILPAGVSHCSSKYNEKYRYIGAYPTNGEHWKSIAKVHIERAKPLQYDNSFDIDISKNVKLPDSDPIYGNLPHTLLDIWRSY